MPRMKDMPSSGAFLRSSVHPVQVGLGASPGRSNSFANAPSKTPPLRSTNTNHPIDLPDSSCFCHRPAKDGKGRLGGLRGKAGVRERHEARDEQYRRSCFQWSAPRLDQRRDGLRNSLANMHISGRCRAIPIGFADPAPRIGAIRPGVEKISRLAAIWPPFPRSSGLPAGPIAVNHPPFLSNTEPCFAARASQSCATFDGCARYLGPFIIISLNAE